MLCVWIAGTYMCGMDTYNCFEPSPNMLKVFRFILDSKSLVIVRDFNVDFFCHQ